MGELEPGLYETLITEGLRAELGELADSDPYALPIEPASVLQAVLRRNPDGTPAKIDAPVIPLLDTTLLTNAPGEPTL